MSNIIIPQNETKELLLGSLLRFTQVFYKLRTGREFEVSEPIGRESHIITICKALTQVFEGKIQRLIINIAPRYGKSELLINFIAWALAHYPDSNFMYLSYSVGLAKKQTQTIRQIIGMPYFRHKFGVEISEETSAKDNFETTKQGSVYAAGLDGTITGRGAGLQYCERFAGAIVVDDAHKPSEVASETMRRAVIDNYFSTIPSRLNNPSLTPIIFIGQRTHEDDLPANMIERDPSCTVIKIPALDDAKNALNPKMHNSEQLLKMQEEEPYVFAAQYQQDPLPAGGGIFKPEWFVLHDQDPPMLATFITADTAETVKQYSDYTVFSFWGIYKIIQLGIDTGLYGLHWIDCYQDKFEPKDLQNEFMHFYASCMRYPIKPRLAIIEKKSTGATLLSVLQSVQGLQAIDFSRSKSQENDFVSKTDRFLSIQKYVAARHVSLTRMAKHTQMCIEHCEKITANNTHRHDDIADTLFDAIKAALVDNIVPRETTSAESELTARRIMSNFNSVRRAQANRQWHK